jgi:hypothetical protein
MQKPDCNLALFLKDKIGEVIQRACAVQAAIHGLEQCHGSADGIIYLVGDVLGQLQELNDGLEAWHKATRPAKLSADEQPTQH